jgi:hypothetical protein
MHPFGLQQQIWFMTTLCEFAHLICVYYIDGRPISAVTTGFLIARAVRAGHTRKNGPCIDLG